MNHLLDIACDAAREAGEEIMKYYASTEFETKSDGSPVTIADKSSNEVLLKRLKETNIPILSEESNGVSVPYPEQIWIIDPLDGTKDFLSKNKDFAVMIGLLEKGRPVLGVVYAPATETLYYAEKGKGAFAVQNGNTTPLKVSDRETQNLRFLRSVNHFDTNMQEVAQKVNAELIPRGSVGIKAALLGEDYGDFFFYNGKLGEWDVCAPEIITIEAGGVVTDCNGNPLEYGSENHRVQHGMVFSNGSCHKHLLEAIAATPPSA